MKQTILDTNFILTCLKQKIDFLEELRFMGFQILIPVKIINELKKLSKTNENARLALKFLQKPGFKKIIIKGKTTDKAIINYANKNPDITIATLDREIKKKTKNAKVVIREKKRLGVV